ncbi:MAG: preprotein translocase subunit YajC [Firmicutes bacterium HGW-Firmicutes-15]|nr:MAG: preprotein translocase subunit YajC [Firmicutes bacterium HGW-Firmicutes-15]
MGAQGQWLTILIYFGVFLGTFYFFIIMPRRKQDKKHKELLANVKRGDLVVTIGGMRGQIAKIKDETVLIKINDSTEIEFLKTAIAYKVEDK